MVGFGNVKLVEIVRKIHHLGQMLNKDMTIMSDNRSNMTSKKLERVLMVASTSYDFPVILNIALNRLSNAASKSLWKFSRLGLMALPFTRKLK